MASHFQPQNHNFYLDLGGQPVGRPASVSAAEDVELAVSQLSFNKKFPSLRRSHIDLALGSNMGMLTHQWLENTLNKSYSRKNGSISVEDRSKKAIRTIEFINALVESIVLPYLDKASKSSESLKVRLIPEDLKMGNTGEKLDQKTAIRYGTSPQPFDTGHFKLTITGLAAECAAVSKIDSITIKQGTKIHSVGDQRSPQIEPTKLDESNLVIKLPASSAQGFLDWYQKSVDSRATDTRSGSLEYFAHGSKSSQFTLNFDGLGLISASVLKDGASDAHRNIKCELYYNSVTLKPN